MQLDKRLKRHLIILMTAMFFVGISATDIYISSLPQMVIDFNTEPSMINLTLSSYSIGIAVIVLFMGEFSNRFGRRQVLLFGLFCFFISAFLMAVIKDLYLMIFLRIIQAIGGAAIIIVPRLILKDCMEEHEQIRANGYLLMGLILSPAIAPVVGAHLSVWFGWRSCFLFSAILGFLLWWRTYAILPETNLDKIIHMQSLSSYLSSYKDLLNNRLFMALTLIYACGTAAYFAFVGVSSYLYINLWHILPVNYSYIYLALAGAYLVGNQIMQFLNKKEASAIQIIALGVYSTLCGVIIIVVSCLFFHHQISVVAFTVTLGVFFMRAANALINPPTQIKIMNYFYPHSAQALGLSMFFSFALNSLATYLVTIFPTYPFTSFAVVTLFFITICAWSYLKNRELIAA